MKRLMIGVGAGAVLAILLSGCSSTAVVQPIKTVTVEVKVKEPCVVVPAKPAYAFGKGEKPESDAVQAQILASDFEKAEQYGIAWEVASTGCRISADTAPAVAPQASDSPRK
jgi:hypothetical protein